MRTLILLLLSAFSFQLSAFAQETAQNTTGGWGIYSGWLTFGAGGNTAGGVCNCLAGTITLQRGVTVVLREAEAYDHNQNHRLDDFALLIGERFNPFRSMVITAALGPAFNKYNTLDDAPSVTSRHHKRDTGGIAGQVEVILPLMIRFGGLGVTAFGNANPRYSYAALSFSLHLGYIR